MPQLKERLVLALSSENGSVLQRSDTGSVRRYKRRVWPRPLRMALCYPHTDANCEVSLFNYYESGPVLNLCLNVAPQPLDLRMSQGLEQRGRSCSRSVRIICAMAVIHPAPVSLKCRKCPTAQPRIFLSVCISPWTMTF
jgi:hypothetical protein